MQQDQRAFCRSRHICQVSIETCIIYSLLGAFLSLLNHRVQVDDNITSLRVSFTTLPFLFIHSFLVSPSAPPPKGEKGKKDRTIGFSKFPVLTSKYASWLSNTAFEYSQNFSGATNPTARAASWTRVELGCHGCTWCLKIA